MPTLNRFRITNFRGIQEAELNIDIRKKSDVVTLIGLNESGKTTVLEALSHFSTGDRTIANLVGAQKKNEHLISLIPIDQRAAFTGSISVEAEFGLEKGEFEKHLEKIGSKLGLELTATVPVEKIKVEKAFKFKDSAYDKQFNYWSGINFSSRKSKKEKFVAVDSENEAWNEVVNSIEKELYEILYFPTFIVDMPSKIYLDEHQNETPINIYYRTVLKDVVKSIGDGLELEKHILDRINSHRDALRNPNWFQEFWVSPERKIVDAVFHKIQQVINREVIGSWEKVFKNPVRSRTVKVEWGVDTSKNELPFVSFGISDGHSVFSIHERSLGFRWFFSYLLFTQFRSKSGKKTIFLFDEPAANLHAKAQTQLMDSIARIVKGGNKVIYSTHSPHLINPAWLGDAVIIENKAINVDAGDDVFAMDTKPTDIKATGYGKFVSEYPEKTTYFQPVWEKLLYETPPIIGTGPFLCVEGISDFHFLSYVKEQVSPPKQFSIVPGVGAGGFMTTLPSLYGTGAKFVLLLDDDEKGRAEKHRYIHDGIIAPNQVFTLADISSDMLNMKLEELLSDSIPKIKDRFEGKSTKKHVAMYLAEANAGKIPSMLDDGSIQKGNNILNWFLSLSS
ncbi:AAA family ATPase [Agrobacterium genomosp. 3]|uniref:AAA family ATPase n=1 Tax=Agrobacterium tomkonis TaxID=1183410 RepID=UPI001CD8F44A|nr:AAA family ATPase [Agrobacterium tomkonis]MCA1877981.1 AAA family ATPase [Agrobacterium tumefaciens]MCA1893206.1 AAA family ATPase [Agrobacterium tomkonis]